MSTDHATAPEAAPEPDASAQADTPRKQGSLVRTAILVVLLILAAVMLFFDRRAQSQAKDLHDSLDQMKSVPAEELPAIEVVHEHIGREPDRAYDHTEVQGVMVEEYHFNVPWRNNTVYVYYTPEQQLDGVSLNQPLTKADL